MPAGREAAVWYGEMCEIRERFDVGGQSRTAALVEHEGVHVGIRDFGQRDKHCWVHIPPEAAGESLERRGRALQHDERVELGG